MADLKKRRDKMANPEERRNGIAEPNASVEVRVPVPGGDRFLAAMARAIAWEIGNKMAVVGANGEALARDGFYVFRFRSPESAREFVQAIEQYVRGLTAEIVG